MNDIPVGKWVEHWPQFSKQLQEKLAEGWVEYGDSSFRLAPDAILSEIQEELVDVCGWGMILWARLEKMKKALEALEDDSTP